jgi:flagellar motor protein MotB
MKENNSTLWIIVAGVVVLALAYWFACVNRGLCAASKKTAEEAKETVKVEAVVSTTTAVSIWDKVAKEPMVIYMDPASGEPVLEEQGDDVRALAAYAKERNANIYITGHASYVNVWKTAQDNSVKNAQAVKDVLVSYGANADRVYVTGKAYSNPIYGKTRDDVANNRAVISVK